MQKTLIASAAELPDDPQWLGRQSCVVIAYGESGDTASADVIVSDLDAAYALAQRVEAHPIAALTLVQVLRSTAILPTAQGLDVESLAYSTLQAGEEFAVWLQTRNEPPRLSVHPGEAVLLQRDGTVVEAVLNRANTRNAISVEMRDAWVEALRLLEADASISELRFRALGACFSIGGDLSEFGLAPDPAIAHWVRSVQSPARLIAQLSDRIAFHVHGACIGSGIELPAFAARVIAHPRSFFQLPELELGLIPGAGGTVSIARRIGRQRTAWMVLSGKRINARTGLEWGLIDEIRD